MVPDLLKGKRTSAYGVPWHSVISFSSAAYSALHEICLRPYLLTLH